MASKKDTAEVVAVISAAYPNFNATEYTVEIYYQTLKDLSAELLKAATLQAVSEPGRKFAPSVGEIRGTILEIRKMQAGVPSSFQAWGEVRQAMIDVGSYNKPEFSSGFITEAVKIMGWRNLCLSENDVADRAHFSKIYDQLLERAEANESLLPQVRGYIEDNRVADGVKLLTEKMAVPVRIHPHTGERL